MIDNKTKVMIYVKNHLNINPTLFGYCNLKQIDYKDIVFNDINNMPNIIHKFRKMYI